MLGHVRSDMLGHMTLCRGGPRSIPGFYPFDGSSVFLPAPLLIGWRPNVPGDGQMFLWGGGGGLGDAPGGESLVWTIVALLFYKTPAFPTLSPVLYPGSKEGLCLGSSALSHRRSSCCLKRPSATESRSGSQAGC